MLRANEYASFAMPYYQTMSWFSSFESLETSEGSGVPDSPLVSSGGGGGTIGADPSA